MLIVLASIEAMGRLLGEQGNAVDLGKVVDVVDRIDIEPIDIMPDCAIVFSNRPKQDWKQREWKPNRRRKGR